MALSHKTRKRLSLLLLVVWLPLYIVAAVSIVNALDRPSIVVELLVYVVLGFLWALPFKFIYASDILFSIRLDSCNILILVAHFCQDSTFFIFDYLDHEICVSPFSQITSVSHVFELTFLQQIF